MKRIIFISLMLLSVTTLKAQVVLEPKHTFNVELGLPITTGNFAYKYIMQGIVNSSVYYQYRFNNNFALGAGGNMLLTTVNRVKVNPSVPGSIFGYGGFVKIGYERFFDDFLGIDFGVKLGYNQNLFQDSALVAEYPSKKYNLGCMTMTPMFALKLMADNANSYSFTLGYTFQDYTFFPGRLGYPSQGLSNDQVTGSTQFLTLGFGYTHYIGRKSED